MPLLLCPSCRAGMRQVEREGVRFEVCPECHGVWLDGGELEAILAAREGAPGRPYRRERPGDEWEERRERKPRGLFGRLLDAID